MHNEMHVRCSENSARYVDVAVGTHQSLLQASQFRAYMLKHAITSNWTTRSVRFVLCFNGPDFQHLPEGRVRGTGRRLPSAPTAKLRARAPTNESNRSAAFKVFKLVRYRCQTFKAKPYGRSIASNPPPTNVKRYEQLKQPFVQP